MARRPLLFILTSILVLFASCKKNEFTVDIDLPADVNHTYTLVYYASDKSKGWMVESVVNVQKGKARLTGFTVKPTLVYILSNSGSAPQAIFYAGRGDHIKISGKSEKPYTWEIRGNDLTDRLSRFRLDNQAAFAATAASAEGTSVLNKAIATFVSKNPASPVSTLLLLAFYDRRGDESGFCNAWKGLRDDALDSRWPELSARADMVGTFDSDLSLPELLVFNTVETGCDTVRPGRVPVLLYFSQPRAASRREDARLLRELSREFKDSSRRIIADISFETDSLSRRSAARRDSLQAAINVWMPLGLSDSTAMALHIPRVPYSLVIDAKGKTVYRGDDLSEATESFKKLMR